MENNNISFILNNHFTIRHCTAKDGRDTPSDFHCGKGLRKWSRFFYLVNGEIDFVSHTGKEVTMKSGDVMFLPYDIEYKSAWTDSRDGYYYSVEFILEYPNGENLNLFDDLTVLFNDNGSYKSLFADIVRTATESVLGSHLKCIEQFVHILHSIAVKIKSGDNDYNDIRPAIEMIENGFSEDTDVDALADLCHVSPATLRRKFLKYAGTSPIVYRNTLRLNKARELLMTDLYTVGEVAEIVGIPDAAYFSKMYKKHFGICPSDDKSQEL